jgi:acyl carrier protein
VSGANSQEAGMERNEQFLQLLYESVALINQERKPEEAIEKSPDAVVMGHSAGIDSLGFVNFVATVEEKIERMYGRQLSLIDVILNDENREWTIGALAARLAAMIRADGSSKAAVWTSEVA